MRLLAISLVGALFVFGCSGSSNNPQPDGSVASPADGGQPGPDASVSQPPDAAAPGPDAATEPPDAASEPPDAASEPPDAAEPADANQEAPDASATTATLFIDNFLAWCAVTVTQPAGATLTDPATSASNSLTAPIGTVVVLHGEPASASFEWVPAGGTGGWSGDIDPGQDGKSKDVTITLTGEKSVSVCCPFTDGTGC